MFTLPTETGERIEQALAQRVCTAADGSYIRRSAGRRRAGRPTKYTVHLATGSSFVIEAFDDGAAVDRANKRTAQHGVQRTVCTSCSTELSTSDVYCPKCGLWNPANRR